MLKLRKGFTLIELLIVVVIIGILAAIAIPKFANTKSKAYITAMKSDLRNLVTAEEAFFADSSKYTATVVAAEVPELHGRGLADDHHGRGLLDGDGRPHAAPGHDVRHRHQHDEPDRWRRRRKASRRVSNARPFHETPMARQPWRAIVLFGQSSSNTRRLG